MTLERIVLRMKAVSEQKPNSTISTNLSQLTHQVCVGGTGSVELVDFIGQIRNFSLQISYSLGQVRKIGSHAGKVASIAICSSQVSQLRR